MGSRSSREPWHLGCNEGLRRTLNSRSWTLNLSWSLWATPRLPSRLPSLQLGVRFSAVPQGGVTGVVGLAESCSVSTAESPLRVDSANSISETAALRSVFCAARVRTSSACFVEFFIAVATTSNVCCALRPVIPDASFLRHEWPKVILPTFGGHTGKSNTCSGRVFHGTQAVHKVQP